MNQTITHVTSQSYISRIIGSLKGIILGFILIIAGLGLLWWNEGRTIKQHQALNEVQSQVLSLENKTIQSDLEGKLVHLQGAVETQEILTDEIFSVTKAALRLDRTVEMYQWQEDSNTSTKTNVGGSQSTTKTYEYEKIWSEKSIRSSDFQDSEKYKNPEKKVFSKNLTAQAAKIGAFNFEPEKINQLAGSKPIELKPKDLNKLPSFFADNGKIIGNYVYNADPQKPVVGDYRVRFSYLPVSTKASVIGQQKGSSLLAYKARSGNSILLVTTGQKTADEMVESAQKNNTIVAWLIRAGGTLLIIFGINLVLAPLVVLASVLPFLGSIAGGINSFVAFSVGTTLSLFTIATAWIFYRPLIGATLFLVGFVCFSLLFFRKKNKDSNNHLPASGVNNQPSASANKTPSTPPPITTTNTTLNNEVHQSNVSKKPAPAPWDQPANSTNTAASSKNPFL